MRIRIKFAKKDTVKFLGHLDIMRFFQRCFNRADVKMEYSIGYNPHQKMSFAQPLGVGILSRGEYLDAEIAEGQDLNAVCRRLNEVCGDGFEVISVKAVQEGAKKAMAALCFAEYEVLIPMNGDMQEPDGLPAETERKQTMLQMQEAVQNLLAMKQLLVIKKTKSGEKETDIRPQICELQIQEKEDAGEPADAQICLHMLLTAGSDNNLKPDTLLSALYDKTDLEYRRERVTIIRKELYAEKRIPLEQFQTI